MPKLLSISCRHPIEHATSRSWLDGRPAPARRWVLAMLLGCVALLAIAPAALAASGTGKIEGKVTEASSPSTGIQNVQVEVFNAGDQYLTSAFTNANGEYTATGLPAGSYEVKFYPSFESKYAPQWWNNEPSFAKGTAVNVEEAKTTSGIDAELREGGQISGTVTDTGHAGLGHIIVSVISVSGSEEFFFGQTETKANGEYTMMGLAAGEYTVEFYPNSSFGLNFVPQYYNNEPSFSKANPVKVEEEKTTSPIDAELQVGGEITGTVTDASTHKPLAEVAVYAEGAGEGFGYAETNANGEYTISGLASGSYNVEFYYEEKGKTEYIAQTHEGVEVTREQTTTGINAAMVRKAPVNTVAPVASGTPAVGKTLSCANGRWTGVSPLIYTYTWLRNGSVIASGSTYVVQSADQLSGLACKVTAKNEHGTASATSNTLTVPLVPPPPPPTPVLTLSTSKIVVSGNLARVPIVCTNATCAGTIELTEQIVVRHRHGRKTKKTLVLGRGAYALASGHSATILVRMTSAGRRALAKARHHRLSAKIIASVIGGATKFMPVVLSEPAPKHRHGRR